MPQNNLKYDMGKFKFQTYSAIIFGTIKGKLHPKPKYSLVIDENNISPCFDEQL